MENETFSSQESKESTEHTDGKGKKRVGIHTDITFEITGAGVAVTKNHTRNIDGEGGRCSEISKHFI